MVCVEATAGGVSALQHALRWSCGLASDVMDHGVGGSGLRELDIALTYDGAYPVSVFFGKNIFKLGQVDSPWQRCHHILRTIGGLVPNKYNHAKRVRE